MSETEPSPPWENATTLEYQQRQRLAWVSRHRKLLIFLALSVAIAIPVWRHWQPIKQQILWRYWFNRAAAFKMPDKSVDLYIDEPMKAKQAVSSSADYQLNPFAGSTSQSAIYSPLASRQLELLDSRFNFMSGSWEPVPFTGTLRRPDGKLRFVVIKGGEGTTRSLLSGISVLVLPLPGWTELPPGASPRNWAFRFGSGPPQTAMRLRSGVTDPADPSHVIFEFVVGLQGSFPLFAHGPWVTTNTGTIDAHLQNDDSIRFKLRGHPGSDQGLSLGVDVINGDPQFSVQEAAKVGITLVPATSPSGVFGALPQPSAPGQ